MNLSQQTKIFSLGRLLITPSALEQIDRSDIDSALGRHARGDWGDLCVDDVKQNDLALREGGRLVSTYMDRRDTRFYIITEEDRSATTLLLPEDY